MIDSFYIYILIRQWCWQQCSQAVLWRYNIAISTLLLKTNQVNGWQPRTMISVLTLEVFSLGATCLINYIKIRTHIPLSVVHIFTTWWLGAFWIYFDHLCYRKNTTPSFLEYRLCKENIWILIAISVKFIPKRSVNNITALGQIMVWRPPGKKPSSEPMIG